MWPWNRALFASKQLDEAVLKFPRQLTYLFSLFVVSGRSHSTLPGPVPTDERCVTPAQAAAYLLTLPLNAWKMTEANCDVTKIKIFELMGFTEIFWKYIMKNVYLPKINILLQFGDEILALSCSSDSTLHTAGAREIWIDQSGFSRREKIWCPDVK